MRESKELDNARAFRKAVVDALNLGPVSDKDILDEIHGLKAALLEGPWPHSCVSSQLPYCVDRSPPLPQKDKI